MKSKFNRCVPARGIFFLTPLSAYSDFGLLLLRLLVGAFLVWGVSDNLFSQERMREFAAFLSQSGFAVPHIMAPLSVWAQFLIGLGFVTGLLTRWAGILCAINFTAALVMVDAATGIRGAFPSACLTAIGIYLALRGAGRYSLDRWLESRLQPA